MKKESIKKAIKSKNFWGYVLTGVGSFLAGSGDWLSFLTGLSDWFK